MYVFLFNPHPLPYPPKDMDDTEFHDLLRRLSEKGFEALYEGDYKHPHGMGNGAVHWEE